MNKIKPMKNQIKLLLLLLGVTLLWPATSPAQGIVAAASLERSLTSTNAVTLVSRRTRVFTVFVQNTSASDLWLHVHDTASTPADGARPALSPVKILAGAGGGYDFGTYGAPFNTGVTVLTSTTDLTLTNSTASFDVTVIHTLR